MAFRIITADERLSAAENKTSLAIFGPPGVGSRASAFLVSRDAEDRPVYGGTPSDFAVVQAVQEMKARGLRVTFYPFILMDVPPGNSLPNPYSDNAAGTGQPAFPWRGRITCSPAAGYAGTVDKTATAASQVATLFGAATPASFSVSGQSVSWTGPSGDWGLRRMVLHYAHLCAAAGGVDAFLIGTEMPGLTTIRSGASTYPAVQAYRDLLADVRSILGSGTKIGYAADWSEYFGHQPGDGSGDVFFHLDPLWADPEIDFVGIDNYMPLSDWRDGFEHADAAEGWPAIYDRGYLQANIAGGEGFDWFYASAADRSAQVRTAITDGAAAKPWVFRYKDMRSWWSNPHYDRPGGVESGTPTAWAPQSKPIWFTELGCPAIDRGTNQPNVFFDPKSSESFTPHFSRGWRDDAIQRAYLEATYLWWGTPATVAEGGSGDLFYTMNKEAAGDDLGLTLQTGFVTKALVGLVGSDRFRLAVSADGSTFFDGLSVDNANGIVDQPRLPRFKAYTNYDNYVGIGTWTKIGLNNTDYNDQGAFDAANNRFVAPADGTYLFGATLLYKINASATARMRGRLVLNGTTEIRGSLGEISATHVSLATAIWLQTMVPLIAGDTVELQGYFRVADGYFAADHTSFWGCKVG